MQHNCLCYNTICNDKKGSAIAPSVVVVKFICRFQRDMIYRARKKLFTSGAEVRSRIFINENLPPDARKLLGALQRLATDHTLSGAWSSLGKIYAKKLDGSIINITKLSDLNAA